MPPVIENSMLAPCGVDCMVCYRHVRQQKVCPGCRNENENKTKSCLACEIKDCEQAGEIGFCFLCAQFPCTRIKKLDKSYKMRYGVSLMENSWLAKDAGVEVLMEQEQKRRACTVCGGVVSLNTGICSECGQEKQRP
ncbi:DUF3795 domain-containing protein [Christensenellaceae bacterium OttesenSCG-928-K19]|nr:DUF3795 domain-containing protein [Christensenellaceae bacterium OttesenSCG-928-K19]